MERYFTTWTSYDASNTSARRVINNRRFIDSCPRRIRSHCIATNCLSLNRQRMILLHNSWIDIAEKDTWKKARYRFLRSVLATSRVSRGERFMLLRTRCRQRIFIRDNFPSLLRCLISHILRGRSNVTRGEVRHSLRVLIEISNYDVLSSDLNFVGRWRVILIRNNSREIPSQRGNPKSLPRAENGDGWRRRIRSVVRFHCPLKVIERLAS